MIHFNSEILRDLEIAATREGFETSGLETHTLFRSGAGCPFPGLRELPQDRPSPPYRE